jgi:hypothetical protein
MRFVYSPVGGSEALRGRVTHAFAAGCGRPRRRQYTARRPWLFAGAPAQPRRALVRAGPPSRDGDDAPSPGRGLEATRPARDRARALLATEAGRPGSC